MGHHHGRQSHQGKIIRSRTEPCRDSRPRLSSGAKLRTLPFRRPRAQIKNKNAARASHPDRICFVGSRSAFVTARRRNDRFGPTALASRRVASATFAEAGCRSARPCGSRIHNRCGGQRSCPARESKRGGGRYARATSRAHARFRMSPGSSPSRTTGCRWLRRNHSASSGMPTFSLRNTVLHRIVRYNRKTSAPCAQTVDVATSLWNVVENLEGIAPAPRIYNLMTSSVE